MRDPWRALAKDDLTRLRELRAFEVWARKIIEARTRPVYFADPEDLKQSAFEDLGYRVVR